LVGPIVEGVFVSPAVANLTPDFVGFGEEPAIVRRRMNTIVPPATNMRRAIPAGLGLIEYRGIVVTLVLLYANVVVTKDWLAIIFVIQIGKV
jgi:hypothetical protein